MPDAAKLPLEALLPVSAFDAPKPLFPNPLPPVLLRPVEPKPFHPPVLSLFELPPPKPEKPEKPEKPAEKKKPEIVKVEKKAEKPSVKKKEIVKTGDEQDLILLTVLCILSCTVIFTCGRIARKTK